MVSFTFSACIFVGVVVILAGTQLSFVPPVLIFVNGIISTMSINAVFLRFIYPSNLF